MTGTTDHAGLFALLGLGASAIVLKSSSVSRLREAIGRALDHGIYVDPDLRIATRETPQSLTPRESEVMELLANGNSNKEIATALEISERTVKSHLAHLFEKLHVTSRTEAVRVATRRGLVRFD